MSSSNAADENRQNEARNLGRASCYVSLAGIGISVIAITIIIIYFVAIVKETSDSATLIVHSSRTHSG